MLRLFEKSTIIQVILILAVTVLLWAKAFATPQPMVPTGHYSPLYDFLCQLALSPTLSTILALLLVIGGGVYLNLILANANLVPQNSLLPTLFFVIAMSANTPALSPALLAALVIVVIVERLLLHSTLLTVPSNKIFATAALIGIASMLYLPALSLIVAYLLIAINYRLYGWRDWMMLLLGLLAPYLFLWSVQLFTDDLLPSFVLMGNDLSAISPTIGDCTVLQGIANIFLLATFIISLFIVWSRLGERPVVWQKNGTTVMILTVAAIAMLPFTQLFPVDLKFFAVPFSFCLCHRLSLPRKHTTGRHKPWRNHLYGLLFILIIIAAILC